MNERWVIIEKGKIYIVDKIEYAQFAICGFDKGTSIEYYKDYKPELVAKGFADQWMLMSIPAKMNWKKDTIFDWNIKANESEDCNECNR